MKIINDISMYCTRQFKNFIYVSEEIINILKSNWKMKWLTSVLCIYFKMVVKLRVNRG